MDLSKKDRIILSNQYRILEKLYPEEADYFSKYRKAIEQGYKAHYEDAAEFFYEEMSEEDSKEVLDILSMYRAMNFSFSKLKNVADITKDDIKFLGFDGNNESQQFSYATYFIVDLGRFDELIENRKFPDLNSHAPTLDRYRRMLRAWKQEGKKHDLSLKQIQQILKA